MKKELEEWLGKNFCPLTETTGTVVCDIPFTANSKKYRVDIAFSRYHHDQNPWEYVIPDRGYVLTVPSFWLGIHKYLVIPYLEYYIDSYLDEYVYNPSSGSTSGDSSGGGFYPVMPPCHPPRPPKPPKPPLPPCVDPGMTPPYPPGYDDMCSDQTLPLITSMVGPGCIMGDGCEANGDCETNMSKFNNTTKY